MDLTPDIVQKKWCDVIFCCIKDNLYDHDWLWPRSSGVVRNYQYDATVIHYKGIHMKMTFGHILALNLSVLLIMYAVVYVRRLLVLLDGNLLFLGMAFSWN